MRRIVAIALAVVVLLPAVASAQKVRRTTITADPRIGFQAGMLPGDIGKEYLFKCGMWAPVSIDIITGDEPITSGELTVEVGDNEDVQNTFTVPIGQIGVQTPATFTTYVRVGSRNGEITARILNNGSEIAKRQASFDSMAVDDLLFVAVGSPLPGLRRALLAQKPKDNEPGQKQMNDGFVARLETVHSMPTKWFAYQAADVVILTTSNADFVKELLSDKPRHQALMEWVVRGGKLVISAGRNADLLPALAPEVLEAADSRKLARLKVVPGGLQSTRLSGIENYARHFTALEGAPGKDEDKPTPIALARFERKQGKDVEVIADTGDQNPSPLLVRIPYGTGQIVLAAFDFDQRPFTVWSGQNEFWKQFQVDLSVELTARDHPNYGGDSNNDIASTLYSSLQSFPEVSNISFGWVALFIFVYILVVGPLDYFFLKKVVKRLELTWITFPTVVLAVSVVAYFTAYALKGNELLINKADLIDIDLEGQTGYGHSWFTLFSPRIQHYTVGVEPAAPVWAKSVGEDDKASTVLTGWMGRPDENWGGFGRSRSQSLFRRSYSYAPDATGLEGVPIQVWSMKSFESSWVRPVNPEKAPFVADLKFTGEGRLLQGTITNQLPVDLVDVSLIFGSGPNRGGTVYSLDEPLVHDVPQRILARQAQTQRLSEWLKNEGAAPQNNVPGQKRPPASTKESIFKRVAFFRGGNTSQQRNVLLRQLDVTWRLGLKSEVILVGRVAPRNAAAEQVTNDPATIGRLWLHRLPAPGETRPELKGTLSQETFVRVFIPVKTEEEK